jgi:hypothetical protein
MFFNRDSAIQKCFQKILHSLQLKKFGSLPTVWTTCHTVWMPICPKHHPSGRRELSVRTFLCVKKLRNCSSLHPSGRFSSTSRRLSVFDKLHDFFPKHNYGKIAATVRKLVIMVRTREHQILKLRASDQPSGQPSSWSGHVKPWYGNYLQQKCDSPDDRTPPSERDSK